MKKNLLIASLFAIALAACGQKEEAPVETTTTVIETTTTAAETTTTAGETTTTVAEETTTTLAK
ncbi:MAG TPA: hypothetical protein DHV59_12980 [Oxalobacteraceae bacterium]|nr:hypothetical protein [Oxalobacteraceae bacterium]